MSLKGKLDLEVIEQSLSCPVAQHKSKGIVAIDFGEDRGRRKIKLMIIVLSCLQFYDLYKLSRVY